MPRANKNYLVCFISLKTAVRPAQTVLYLPSEKEGSKIVRISKMRAIILKTDILSQSVSFMA